MWCSVRVDSEFYFYTFDRLISHTSSEERVPAEETYATVEADDTTLISCGLYTNAVYLNIKLDSVRGVYGIHAALPDPHLLKLLWNLPSETVKNLVRRYIGYEAQNWTEAEVHLMAKILGGK